MTAWESVKRLLPQWLAGILRRVYYSAYRVAVRVWCSVHRLGDALASDSGKALLAPPWLRYKVGGTPSRRDFLETGRGCADNLNKALAAAGIGLDGDRSWRILDFGCGCGRTLTWLAKDFPDHNYYGTDADTDAVLWCREHLGFACFDVSQRWPPLSFGETRFNLVYAISVFTHLEKAEFDRWLQELSSCLTSAGVLFLTVHGQAVWSHLPTDQKRVLQEQGQLTLSSRKLHGIFPDWYQTTFHTESYVREACSRHFEHVDYFAQGMGYQDAIVCQGPRQRGGLLSKSEDPSQKGFTGCRGTAIPGRHSAFR